MSGRRQRSGRRDRIRAPDGPSPGEDAGREDGGEDRYSYPVPGVSAAGHSGNDAGNRGGDDVERLRDEETLADMAAELADRTRETMVMAGRGRPREEEEEEDGAAALRRNRSGGPRHLDALRPPGSSPDDTPPSEDGEREDGGESPRHDCPPPGHAVPPRSDPAVAAAVARGLADERERAAAELIGDAGGMPEDELLDGLAGMLDHTRPAPPAYAGGSFESDSTGASVNWDNFAYSVSDESGGVPAAPGAPSGGPAPDADGAGARAAGASGGTDLDARLELLAGIHERDMEAVRNMRLSVDVSRPTRTAATPPAEALDSPTASATPRDSPPDVHVGDCLNLWKMNSNRFDEGLRRAREALSEGGGGDDAAGSPVAGPSYSSRFDEKVRRATEALSGGGGGPASPAAGPASPPSSPPPVSPSPPPPSAGRADHFVFDSPRVAARERTTRELMEKNRELEEEMRRIRLLSPASSAASPRGATSPASSNGAPLSPAWTAASPSGSLPSPAATPRSVYAVLSERERRVNDKASRIISEFTTFFEEHEQKRGDIMRGLDM